MPRHKKKTVTEEKKAPVPQPITGYAAAVNCQFVFPTPEEAAAFQLKFAMFLQTVTKPQQQPQPKTEAPVIVDKTVT